MATQPHTFAQATPFAARVVDALRSSGLTLTAQNIAAVNLALEASMLTQSPGGITDACKDAHAQFCDGFTEALIATVASPDAAADGYTLGWDDRLQKHVCLVRMPHAAHDYSVALAHPDDLEYQHAEARELGCIVGIAVLKSLETRPAVLNRFDGAMIERDSGSANDQVVGVPARDSAGNEIPCPFCACQAAYDSAVRADGCDPTGTITQMRQFGHVILFQMDADVHGLYALHVLAGTLLSARFVNGLFSEPERELLVGDSVWIVDSLVKWANAEDIKAFGHFPADGVIAGLVQRQDGSIEAIFAEDTHVPAIPIVGLVRKTEKAAPPMAKHLH